MPKPILLEDRANFPRPFRAVAATAWAAFLKVADPSSDLAHWFIEADSATIRLTARSTLIDEDDPGWIAPIPIVVLVDGILEQFDTEDHDAVRRGFYEWAAKGIVESFKLARVRKALHQLIPTSACFGVVTSQTDEGLARDELSLLWANHERLTLARIRAQQSKATKPKKHIRKIRK